jgi:Protein-tyrosine-phosphatase
VSVAAEIIRIFAVVMKKKRILFVCLGNICRSPMAEAIFRHLAAEAGRSDEFEISSAAVSEEEWGNPIYPLAAAILNRHHIAYDGQRVPVR